jgi:hypothetical protein
MPLKTLIDAWNKFWFEETSPLILGVFRILIGTIYLLFALLLWSDRFTWFGNRALASQAATDSWCGISGLNLLSYFHNDSLFIDLLFLVYIICALLFLLGYHSRLCAIGLYIGLVSLLHRNPFIFNSGDTYMRVTAFWLMFAPCDRALSLSNYLARKKKHSPVSKGNETTGKAFETYPSVSIWPQRLLQLQLATVYCHTFFAKVVGPAWIDGWAVYYSSHIEDLQRFPLPFILNWALSVKLLTWGTLLIEILLWTLIWIKEFRYPVLIFATIFHLVIEWHMNIPLFEYLMIASYFLFIPSAHMALALRFCLRLSSEASTKENTQTG